MGSVRAARRPCPRVGPNMLIKTRYVRKYKNKCAVCGHTLSVYNKNKYCFVHMMKGFDIEWSNMQRKQYTANRSHRLELQAAYRRSKGAKKRCLTSSR